MIIKDNKKFMDSVYGYIGVPKCFVENIIDTDYFQRLRNIDQTGMRIVYPCAKHDRFSHSIGVFHLGQKAVDALINNYYDDGKSNSINDEKFKLELERNKILFLIACLLHDIGHTPFSHSLEDQVLENSKHKKNINVIKEKLVKKFKEVEQKYNDCFKIENTKYNKFADEIGRAASHEQMGSLLIFNEFKNNIKKIFKELNNLYDNTNFCFEEANNNKVSDIILEDDLSFIARMIMGIKYKEIDSSRQMRNCFIELLNGKNFDVDNLDYIIRDTQMSGISNTSLDLERLLSSLCIKKTTKFYDKKFKNKEIKNRITILEIENNKKKKLSIDANFMGTIIIKQGSEVTIKKNSNFEKLTGKDSEAALIHLEKNNLGVFSKNTIVKTYGYTIGELKSDESGKKYLRGEENNVQFGCRIENAKTEEHFKFKVDEDVELSVNGQCSITIYGTFESNSAITLFSTKSINGQVSKFELLGNAFEEKYTNEKENDKVYNSYCICYKKQAVNVIANVLKARNFLYLWIYAHHKVVYYANFLIPIISKELSCLIKDRSNTFPEWKLNFDNIKYLDDCYIWTLMRHIIYVNSTSIKNKLKITDIVKGLLNEVLDRKYRKSLYKSLVEYDLFFENFSRKEMMDLIVELGEFTDVDKPYILNSRKEEKNKYEVGYFKDETVKSINEKLASSNCQLEELVYVFVNYKHKRLDSKKVYIELGNELVPAERMPLLETNQVKTNDKQKKYYFYMYYKLKENGIENYQLTNLKEIIKDYFKNLIKQEKNKKKENE